jgi:hypothetical protein
MTARLIRMALHAFPAQWRRRYGAEVQQLSMDLLAQRPSPWRRVRVLFGLVACGIDERAHALSSIQRAALVATAAAALAATIALSTQRAGRSPLASDRIYGLRLVSQTAPAGAPFANVAKRRMFVIAIRSNERSARIGARTIAMKPVRRPAERGRAVTGG